MLVGEEEIIEEKQKTIQQETQNQKENQKKQQDIICMGILTSKENPERKQKRKMRWENKGIGKRYKVYQE